MRSFADIPLTVFAFHGCDADVADRVIAGEADLVPSDNDYDWLGTGVYFWENAPERALRWAQDTHRRNPERVRKPAVVGAVVSLGRCLNLMDKESNEVLANAYAELERIMKAFKHDMPENVRKFHYRDALVINLAYRISKSMDTEFDTVRAAFIEGKPVFNGSSIMDDTHIQLCVRNPAKSVIAYFRPRRCGHA